MNLHLWPRKETTNSPKCSWEAGVATHRAVVESRQNLLLQGSGTSQPNVSPESQNAILESETAFWILVYGQLLEKFLGLRVTVVTVDDVLEPAGTARRDCEQCCL